MFNKIVAFIKASQLLQFILVFIAGGAVAAIFYPTKQIKETLQKTYQQQITTMNQQNQQTIDEMQKQYVALSSQYETYHDESEQKITSLTTQVTTLQSHTKTTTFKIVHPDGTVEERDTAENDTDTSDQVTQQMQSEWQQKTDSEVQSVTQQYQTQISTMQTEFSSKEASYQSQIATLTSTKTETTNPKNFTIEGGMLTNTDYYGHITYDIFGPFIVGVQAQFGATPAAGLGVGLRF